MHTALWLTFFCFAREVLLSDLFPPCKSSNRSCLNVLANNLKPIMFAEIPELGVESSDPLFVEKIEADISNLTCKFFNSTFVGYSKCLLSNVKFNEDITTFQYDMECPKISMSGKYITKGHFMTLPVEGNGDFELITGKYFVHFGCKSEKPILEDGKPHLALKDFKLKCVPQTAFKFDFKNLYNGQKDLSDAFHKLIHENWQEVAELVQDLIWDTCMDKVINNTNTYLKSYPLDKFLVN